VISLNPLHYLMLGMAVVIAVMIGVLAYKEHQYNKLEKEYAQYQSTQLSLMVEAERKAKEKLDAQVRATAEIEQAYSEGLAVTSASLNDALRRVRLATASARDRKPAPSAPAECQAYDASPAQLSEQDREFLVRLGSEADQLAQQVNALQQYIKEITK